MNTWTCKPFDALTPAELYAILQLRNEVFVVEQQCVFQDADNKDQASHHLTGWRQGQLVAYTRLVPPGVAYEEPSIGRVVTAVTARGSGIGRQLMEQSVAECRRLFGNTVIRIGAQLYLKQFYASLGFVPTGGIYPEDGIDHIQMLLS
ncbi:MAG: GNAT family N-acetyltransferase [Chitinophagaceae bacterium]